MIEGYGLIVNACGCYEVERCVLGEEIVVGVMITKLM